MRADNIVQLPYSMRPITASGPLWLLLNRLQGVRKAGKGYVARCPAHEDKSPSLSLAESSGGVVLLHCFGGCPAAAVLEAVGLSLGALFPERINATPEQRREARQWAREANWVAAIDVLVFEALIVLAACKKLENNEPFANGDAERLRLAAERIQGGRDVLRGR